MGVAPTSRDLAHRAAASALVPIIRWTCDVASIEVRRDVRIVASRAAGPDIGGKNAGCESKQL